MKIREVAAKTDTGLKRSLNEDSVVSLEDVPLFAVADGMGGEGAGDVASGLASTFLSENSGIIQSEAENAGKDGAELDLATVMETLLVGLHEEISEAAEALGGKTMATTLVAALVAGNHAYIAHVGDTRAYLFRDGRLRLLTDDHTLAMLRYRQGRMTDEEFRTSPLRHKLYQALGSGAEVDVDTAAVRLADDDVFLLTSDGVHAQLEPKQILGCIRQGNLAQGVARLIDAANRAGGKDNATAVMFRVGADHSAEQADAITAVLREVFLFRDLSDAERNVLAPYLDQRYLEAGQLLFSEGDPGDAFYVVLEGKVRITKGETHLIDIGPGGHLGELCLARPVPRSATVQAIERTLVFGLSRDRFQEILKRRPSTGAKLSMSVLDNVGNRLRELTDRVEVVRQVARGEIKPPGMSARDAIIAATQGKIQRR